MAKSNTILDEHLYIRKSKQQNILEKLSFRYYNIYLQLKVEIENPSLPNQPPKKIKVNTKRWKNTKRESELEIDEEDDTTKTDTGNPILEPEDETNGTFNDISNDTCKD